jgi:hypothetical protein
LVAEALEKRGLAESAAIDACVTDETVLGERRWRLGAGDSSKVLLGDCQVGAVLGDDVLVDLARCLLLVSNQNLSAAVFYLQTRIQIHRDLSWRKKC